MRRCLGRKPAVLVPLAGLLLLACGGLEPAPRPPEPAARAGVVAEAFSSERAWAHFQALAALGPRPPGSAASQAANEYLRTRLEALELEVEEVEVELTRPAGAGESATLALHHLVARVPGDSAESPDPMLLVAHYDTRAQSPGANDGASGPALLLELARQLAERPLPYRVELWFLDGEMGAPPGWPNLPPLTGSRQLVRAMAERLDDLRLVVAFRRVAGAELTIGRDRFSDAASREEFFRVARELGHGAAFPTDRGYVEAPSSGRVFWDAGQKRVVSILDPGPGDGEPAAAAAGEDTPERCSPESLQTVGEVTLVTLRRLGERFRKVDRLTGRAERRAREALAPALVESEPGGDSGVAETSETPADAPPEARPEGP